MTHEELRRIQTDMGWSAREMARQLGLARNTMNAYLNGTAPIPRYIGLATAALVAGLPGYHGPAPESDAR